jgi:ABC-type multidrug transport system fused ATPase/permease subunit
MLYKFSKILSYSSKKNLIILTFLWLILYFLEVVGIGTIPLILSVILENQGFESIKFLSNITAKFSTYVFFENKILLVSFFVILFFAFKNIYLLLVTVYEARILKKLNVEIRDQVFRYHLKLPYINFLNIGSSQIVRSITLDASEACSYIVSVVTLVGQSFLFFFILCLLAMIDYKVTFLILPIFAIIFYLFYFLTNKKLVRLGEEKQILGGKMIKKINNTFENLKEVKIYNKISFIAESFKKICNSNQDKIATILILKKIPRATYEFLGVILIFSIILYLTYSSYSKEDIIILLSLVTISIIRILPSINLITQSVANLKSSQYSFNSISNFILKDITNSQYKIKKSNNKIIFNKKIEFKNISFNYKNSKYKLEKLNFSINKNSNVGIYGASGSGKSTIINLLTGLLYPNEGKIIVDDEEIGADLLNWQAKIGYVTQENYLMDDTILNNILFSDSNNEYDKEKLNYSTSKTKINEFVVDFENGLDTEVGDKGMKLSGGQKQRIAIARALYKNPEIIIFDESTSALDNNSEKNIIEDIYKIKDKTIILISHKKELLKNCDKIISLSKNSSTDSITLSETIN